MITLKSKSLKWLRDYGCDETLIHLLEKMGVKLEVIKTKGAIQDIVTGVHLWAGESMYKVGLVQPVVMNQFLSSVITTVNEKAVAAAQEVPASKYTSGGSKPVPAVVRLRDAKAMYQRVEGTSAGSVYVVVAMTKGLKVAAKIDSAKQLSVRAECDGEFYNEYRNALIKQGMKFNDAKMYMSGHYPCNDDAPPGKVLGAILFGSGLQFETPMPNLELIKEGSES